ncbi:MAG TPA: hypothetical protein VMD08_06090 [Candidatus Baltobacteraceae bacterium]|nr:hypothetical protein [Candidatus Baltobacteraceae bacterium]
MDPISTIGAAIDVGLKLPELGRKLYELIESAKGPRVERKVLLYLQVAQRAIRALGRERQGILADAAGCDVQKRAQIEALSERMRVYLQEDNVRDPLKKAIGGLRGCRQDIERAAQGLRWRKRDKQKAVQAFLSTLGDLDAQAQALEHKFFPEYSGQGLGTLVPVFELVARIEEDFRRGRAPDVDADEEKLAELIRDALRDPAQGEWIEKAAHIEGLIVELQLSFSIKGGSFSEER